MKKIKFPWKLMGFVCLLVFGVTSCEDDFTTTQTTTAAHEAPYVPQKPERTGDTYAKEFSWRYKGEDYRISLEIRPEILEHYYSLPHDQAFEDYVFEDSAYQYVDAVCQLLYKQIEYKGFSEREVAEYLLAFIQSFPYVKSNRQYRQYLIVTLYSSGDCDAFSLAYATLLSNRHFGIRCALIRVPGHMLVGVSCQECEGYYISQNGERFYIAETTSDKPLGHKREDYDLIRSISVVEIPQEHDPQTFFGTAPLHWLKEGKNYQINIRSDEGTPHIKLSVNGKPVSPNHAVEPNEDDSDTPSSIPQQEDDSDTPSNYSEEVDDAANNF